MTGRRVSTALVFVVLSFMLLNPQSSSAQVASNVRVVVPAARVYESASSRSITVMTALGGSVFEVLGKEGDWYWIILPPDHNGTSRPGFIGAENIEVVAKPDTRRPIVAAGAPPSFVGLLPPDASPDLRELNSQVEALQRQMQALQLAGGFAAAAPRPVEARMQTIPPDFEPADRGGFTILVDVGVGIQRDTYYAETASGLGGLNVGLGAFLSRDLALMIRFSGTNVSYERYSQMSGVIGPMVQYWVSDRVNLRGGVGVGFWKTELSSDNAFGLMLGAGVTVFSRGKHNLQIGGEYSPVFTKGRVHNIGFTFGYQLL